MKRSAGITWVRESPTHFDDAKSVSSARSEGATLSVSLGGGRGVEVSGHFPGPVQRLDSSISH
jgi:hypothetical protein